MSGFVYWIHILAHIAARQIATYFVSIRPPSLLFCIG